MTATLKRVFSRASVSQIMFSRSISFPRGAVGDQGQVKTPPSVLELEKPLSIGFSYTISFDKRGC